MFNPFQIKDDINGCEDLSVQECSALIRDDDDNYYDNSDDLMDRFDDVCYNIVPEKLPMVFYNSTIPETPLE